MAGEAGEALGTERRRPSHEDGSYEATRCYKYNCRCFLQQYNTQDTTISLLKSNSNFQPSSTIRHQDICQDKH